MSRFLLLPVVFLNLVIPLSATLVIAIPTAEGIVVAADSRSMIGGKACDNAEKIRAGRWPERSIIVASGWAGVLQTPKSNTHRNDPCRDIASGKRTVDIGRFAVERLGRGRPPIGNDYLTNIGREIIDLLGKRQISFADHSPGTNLFAILVARFDFRKNVSLIDVLETTVNDNHLPEVSDVSHVQFGPDQHPRVMILGDVAFIRQHVLNDKALANAISAIEGDEVKHVSIDRALSVASDLIARTARETDIWKTGWNVGGPVHAYLAGKGATPTRLK